MRRITLREGDVVKARETVLAVIEPQYPLLLDERMRREAEAAVRAAEATLQQADPAIDRAQAELAQANIESRRLESLAAKNAASPTETETAKLTVTAREADVRAAHAAREVARFQLEQSRAALLAATSVDSTAPFEVRAPVDGQVLRVLQESEAAVTLGMSLLEIGDVRDIEAVIDVLSRDAVRVSKGDAVLLERWGGDQPLRGVVRRVEPSAFTEISALGVEEQRVNVIVDLAGENGAPVPSLGDGFRVDARIVVWQRPDALKAPAGALFRTGDDWAAFVLSGGRALLRRIHVGQMNGAEAEVLDGLAPGDAVILYPSDRVHDGTRVAPRAE
jgi:HlyD family secretion protein